nr:sugar ABC transporter permease [Kribbella italica]
MLIAVLIMGVKRGRTALRVVFYFPSLVPPVAAGLAFVYLLNPGTGPVNKVLAAVGVPAPQWFESPTWSKPALILLSLWGVGTFVVIFYTSLLDVPLEQYEAASIDGAGAARRFWHITLPTLRPVILFASITGVIDVLQYFAQPYVVAQVLSGGTATTAGTLGYPQDSTMFYSVLLYKQGFQNFNLGYASALASLLFVVSIAVAALFVRRARTWF